jgi:hypothetical protein
MAADSVRRLVVFWEPDRVGIVGSLGVGRRKREGGGLVVSDRADHDRWRSGWLAAMGADKRIELIDCALIEGGEAAEAVHGGLKASATSV